MSFLIELFQTMIMTFNIFIELNKMFIVAINLLKMRNFENEFIIIKKLNEYLIFKTSMSLK